MQKPEKTKTNDALIRAILDGAGDAIRVIGLGFNIQHMNHKMELLGQTDLYDQSSDLCHRHLAGELCQTNKCTLTRILDGEQLIQVDMVRKTQTGAFIPMEMVATPLVINGKIQGVIESFRDISARKKAEKDIQEYQNRLRELSANLAKTKEVERRELATILHDGLSQDFFALQAMTHSLLHSTKEEDRESTLQDMLSLIQTAQQKTRNLTQDLYPPILYEEGLVPALKMLAEKTTREKGLACQVETKLPLVELTPEALALLFQAIRELTNNVYKHAQARTIVITLSRHGDKLEISVTDDGVGITPETKPTCPTSGFGLFLLRERVAEKSGELIINSQPHKGTKVTIMIPEAKLTKKRSNDEHHNHTDSR